MSKEESRCDLCGKNLVSYFEKSNSEIIVSNGKELFLCPNCKINYKDDAVKLSNVLIKNEEDAKISAEKKRVYDSFIITTTNRIDNKNIIEYFGVISAEVVEGVGIFKDAFAGLRNTFGGRSQTMKKVMKEMREEAIIELKNEAMDLGANGIVGVSLDFDEYAEKMMMLTVSGTAVKFEE